MQVKISDIKVKKRVRKELGEMEQLKDSMRSYGLLNPITLNTKYELIAGQRRLEAAKALGWETIAATILSKETDAIKELEMELEENNQRKEFTQEELLEGYHRLEKLRNPSFPMKVCNFFRKLLAGIAEFFKRLFHKKGKKKPPAQVPAPQVTMAPVKKDIQN